MRNFLILLCFAVFLPAMAGLGCGARRAGGGEDALSLLKEGRCEEARRAAEVSRTMDSQSKRTVVAFCSIVPSPSSESGKHAVTLLRAESGEIHSAAAAEEMLRLNEVFPDRVSSEASKILAEAALGAVGFGPLAPKNGSLPSDAVGAATRNLAVSVLERAAAATEGEVVSMGTAELLVIWNSCFSLLGGTFEVEDSHEAWRLFTSLANIALFAFDHEPTADLTEALLSATVSAVEANPPIQPAVRCDLSSPFDALKNALAYKRPLLGRLEAAVKGAIGCSRGTFAP